ncbi:MAG: hypothetical protein CM15mP84_05960 [Cellvibrionales bacterium]|nr:MAG: hypothetical protein CM15mP84_05960 [Cellvibrionales bacterium]
MVSRATFIACEWIHEQRPEMLHYMLSGNFDTEKKTSSVNLLKTRGKRVTAEITVPRDILMKHLRVALSRLHTDSKSQRCLPSYQLVQQCKPSG